MPQQIETYECVKDAADRLTSYVAQLRSEAQRKAVTGRGTVNMDVVTLAQLELQRLQHLCSGPTRRSGKAGPGKTSCVSSAK